MLLLKERWVGGNLTLFGPSWLSTKKVCLTSSEAKRVLLWYVLYFFGLRRLNWTKKDPPGVFFGVFRLSKLWKHRRACTSRARKIHESVPYQAFLCLFFELAKNEEGPEFSFLDSLNFYKKEGREVHSHVFYIMAANLVSLNNAPILSLSTVGS